MEVNSMRNRRFPWEIIVGLLISIYVALAMMAPAPSQAAQPIAYRLKWLINASTAGDVMAVNQGFFAREGLAVEVKAGGPERDAIRELELGYAQFGVASADQVIRALSKGGLGGGAWPSCFKSIPCSGSIGKTTFP